MKLTTFKGLVVLCLLFSINTAIAQFNGNYTFLAKLKDDIGTVDVKIGDQILFSIHPEQEFIYDTFGKQAWLPNGKFGKVDESMIERIPDGDYFRFDHSPDFFKLHDEDILVTTFKEKNLDYREMLTSSLKGNFDDFERMFLYIHSLTGTAGEMHKTMVFKVFSKWSDENFAKFLTQQKDDIKKIISNYLVEPATTWPIEDYRTYYNEFYPESFEIIKEFKDL